VSAYLSIVIVAYKSRPEIGDCLASVPRELRGGGVEVIVVDNGPDDGTEKLVRTAYPHVHYIAPPANLGFGAGNNLALEHASGHLALILNPDTVCNRSALEHCASLLEEDASLGLVSPALRLPDGSLDAACRRSIPTVWDGFCRASGLARLFPRTPLFCRYNLSHLPENGRYEVEAINGAFMMARRSTLEQVALPRQRERVQVFDERHFMYGDDLDLCIRVTKAGKRILYDGSHAIVHLKGVSVARDYDTMSRAIFDANRDVLLRHCNPTGSRLVALRIRAAFGLWKWVSLARARLRGRRKVRPL
jgi:N-acetylglucosaminyl-diphospho-decaprenol L-rhamnosyltransferase